LFQHPLIQRIDLNLVVDYKRSVFFENVAEFVSKSLGANSELLSLLISSLENANVGLRKYGSAMTDASDSKEDIEFFRCKVNMVCSSIQTELIRELDTGRVNAVNPILCALAKQEPAQLVEALSLVRRIFAGDNDALLSGPRAQAALKYLAFLIDSERVFRAALGECDFSMCRAIGRQSQMDPKVLYNFLYVNSWHK
jgi:elongator complex protein 1